MSSTVLPLFRATVFQAILAEEFNQKKISAKQPNNKSSSNCCRLLTVSLADFYHRCNPGFLYTNAKNPRRLLTVPSTSVDKDSLDNSEGNLIVHVNDEIFDSNAAIGPNSPHIRRYSILEVCGSGQFGQVFKALPLENNSSGSSSNYVAIKIIKNREAYTAAGYSELAILSKLNSIVDPADSNHFCRLIDSFEFCKHLCLVFHFYSINLYELIKQNQFQGFQYNLIRKFSKQLLESLICLAQNNIIHSDLKPENILLENPNLPNLRLIDFGSSSYINQSIYTYIQSRFYRSPEILLGISPYNCAIDMWSFGCIVAEMYCGLPLFPGQNQHNQLDRIIQIVGKLPVHMIQRGKNSSKFYNHGVVDNSYHFKSISEWCGENNLPAYTHKTYFKGNSLQEVIHFATKKNNQLSAASRSKASNPSTNNSNNSPENNAENGSSSSNTSSARDYVSPGEEECLLDFVQGLLCLDPVKRWIPQDAINHPFIQKIKFTAHSKAQFYQSISEKRDSTPLRQFSPLPHAIIQSSSAPSQFQLAELLQSNSPLFSAQFAPQNIFIPGLDLLNSQFSAVKLDNSSLNQASSANFANTFAPYNSANFAANSLLSSSNSAHTKPNRGRGGRPLNIPPPKLKFHQNFHGNQGGHLRNRQQNYNFYGENSPTSANNVAYTPQSNSPLSGSPIYTHSPIIRHSNIPANSPNTNAFSNNSLYNPPSSRSRFYTNQNTNNNNAAYHNNGAGNIPYNNKTLNAPNFTIREVTDITSNDSPTNHAVSNPMQINRESPYHQQYHRNTHNKHNSS
jgi:dual specificity protein kinase YAK1